MTNKEIEIIIEELLKEKMTKKTRYNDIINIIKKIAKINKFRINKHEAYAIMVCFADTELGNKGE